MFNLNLMCPINTLGYGIVGTNVTKALLDEGINLSLFPINEQNVEAEEYYHNFIKVGLENAQDFDYLAPCIKIFHQFSMATRIGGSTLIGWPIFELNQFTKLERNHLHSCDHLLVCSKWAKNVCVSQGLNDVSVVPLGVNQDIFKPLIQKSKSAKTIFYMGGKYELRKNHDVVLECFNRAFENNDNVELWVSCYNPFFGVEGNNEWSNRYKSCKLGHKIKIIGRVNSQNDLNYLMNQVSYGVSLSRAEGFDLPLLEMMATGRSSLVSDVTAHTDFANEENSFLISMPDTEPAIDNVWFKPNNSVNCGNWAKVDQSVKNSIVEQLRIMHKLYQQDDSSLERKRKMCLEKAKELSWKNTAQKIIQELQ